MSKLEEEEIKQTIFSASPSPLKAPGIDRVPALEWQKSWPVT